MARMKIEEVFDHLSSEMWGALDDAARECAPDTNIDAHELFRAFERALRRKCSSRELGADQYVEKD